MPPKEQPADQAAAAAPVRTLGKVNPTGIHPQTEAYQKKFLQRCQKGTRVAVKFMALDHAGWGLGVLDRQGEVTSLNESRSIGIIRVKNRGSHHHDFSLPIAPVDQNPVILELRIPTASVLSTLIAEPLEPDVVTADHLYATLLDAVNDGEYDRWAAEYTNHSGLQIVPNRSQLAFHVGQSLTALSQATHDNLVLAIAMLHGWCVTAPNDTITPQPQIKLIQRLLDDWTVLRLKKMNGTAEVFMSEIASNPAVSRLDAFEKAASRRYVKEKASEKDKGNSRN